MHTLQCMSCACHVHVCACACLLYSQLYMRACSTRVASRIASRITSRQASIVAAFVEHKDSCGHAETGVASAAAAWREQGRDDIGSWQAPWEPIPPSEMEAAAVEAAAMLSTYVPDAELDFKDELATAIPARTIRVR